MRGRVARGGCDLDRVAANSLELPLRLLRAEVDRAVAELTRWVKPSTQTIQSEAIDELKALATGVLFELRATDESRQALAAHQIALLEAIRRHRMRVDPVVLAYVKVVVTMDSLTSELSPTLDVVKLQLRFFSAMTLDEIHDSLRPAAGEHGDGVPLSDRPCLGLRRSGDHRGTSHSGHP